MAAVAWIGGGIFYLLVLRPGMRQSSREEPTLGQAIGQEFRGLVNVAIVVLIVTGTIMTFNRLTSDFVGVPYVAVLAAKITLAFYAFYLVRFLRWGTYPSESSPPGRGVRRLAALCTGTTAILIVGMVVVLLSDVLSALFENALKG